MAPLLLVLLLSATVSASDNTTFDEPSSIPFEITGPEYIQATVGKSVSFTLEVRGLSENDENRLKISVAEPDYSTWNSTTLTFTWTPYTPKPVWLGFVGELDGQTSILTVKVLLCLGCIHGKCDFTQEEEKQFTLLPCNCFDGWQGNICSVLIPKKIAELTDEKPIQAVGCSDPPDLEHSRHELVSNDIALYYCDSGYYMKDATVARLQCNMGKWEGELPQCLVVPSAQKNCSAPERIAHGNFMHYGVNGGGTLEYFCKTKYKLLGTRYLTCTNGKWNPSPPACVLDRTNYCQKPKPILHGQVVLFNMYNTTGQEWKNPPDSLPPGTLASYICVERGYGIPGYKTYPPQVCKRSRWRGIVPQCVQLKCRQPIEPRGGNYHYVSAVHDGRPGTVIQFECYDGYELHGAETLTCNYEGVWDNIFPKCIRKIEMCNAPLVPEHGYFKCVKGTCRGYPVGTLLHYQCTPGYETMGGLLIECQEGGMWSGKGPVCVPAGTSLSPMLLDDSSLNGRNVTPDVDLSTITIVVATCCSILGVLVLVMIAVAFQRCQKSARFCSPIEPPPPNIYPPPANGNTEEHDWVALIAFVDGMHVPVPNTVALPSYEEAMRGRHSSRSRQYSNPPAYCANTSGTRPPPDYRLMPSHHAALRVGRTDSIRSSPAFRDGVPDHHRNSIITMGSNATRDNVSEVLGSIDTMNVSDGTSTTATVGTVGSSISNPSIALSHRAVAGSLLSSDGSLAITEDAPLLDPSDKEDTRSTSRSEASDIQAKEP